MAPYSFSSAHVSYLERAGPLPGAPPPAAGVTSSTVAMRRQLRVLGIKRTQKRAHRTTGRGATPNQLLTKDVLIGLYGLKIPLSFLVTDDGRGVSLQIGTWSPAERESLDAETMEVRAGILATCLETCFPAIELEPVPGAMPPHPRCAVGRGIPSFKPGISAEDGLPMDRLIRGMAGARWAFLVLADPVDEETTTELRDALLREAREVKAAALAMRAPEPLVEHYLGLLQRSLVLHGQALSEGAWRTGVYLLGDQAGFHRLLSIWHGLFLGRHSTPEPLHAWSFPGVTELARDWALPEVPGAPGPGHFTHPFEYQTFLSSSQLATYVHLPRDETAGFAVGELPDFDVVPAVPRGTARIRIGEVLQQGRATGTPYVVGTKSLTRHTFVAGVTGAGKTNTIFHLLLQAHREGVGFLVIEPAKTEYRELLRTEDLRDDLRVFTPGNELTAPLRMNPFEPLGRTSVGVHIDLLRSLFTASFGMWTPLPQILERSLHRLYADRGWEIATNTNERLGGGGRSELAWPTLTDLVHTVDEVTARLGYEGEFTANAKAALHTRINSLRTGGKGRMLDTRRSVPFPTLLEGPSVLELEGMGDDDDKAFLIGLLLIRLVEHLRCTPEAPGLRHLLVIEEAHRLLTNVAAGGREEEASPRAKAVETFSNLLSEIRAYGQGVVVADQVPVKLAPDVIKNTNLKIAHRVVARDDRETLAGAMVMNEAQAWSLATLGRGDVIVFAENDDAPLLVHVPKAKPDEVPGEQEIRARWEEVVTRHGLADAYETHPTCAAVCGRGNGHRNPHCSADRHLAERREVHEALDAFVLSLAVTPPDELAGTAPACFRAVASTIRPHLHPDDRTSRLLCVLSHGMHRALERIGRDRGWSFQDTAEATARLLSAVAPLASGRELDATAVRTLADVCRSYRDTATAPGPFFGCDRVCATRCMFRRPVAGVLSDPGPAKRLRAALESGAPDALDELDRVCGEVAERVLLPPVPNRDRQR
ncbi:MAG: DUF87 domain-containing protein, partial [Acidobacteriota bacterium]